MNNRRGTTLIELMMCMAAGSSLMLLAIGLVHQALTISSQSSQQIDQARCLARLATQFRGDAHRALQASADSDTQLRMSFSDDSQVIYRFADHRLTRRHEFASGEVQNESFAFNEQYTASLRARSDPERAELLIRRETNLNNVAPRTELHIVAAIRRLPRAEQGGEEAER